MDKINIDELRHVTHLAIEEGKRKREKELAKQAEKIARYQEEQQLKAKHIIEQIPGRCMMEASAGRNHAVVMSLKYYNDYEQPPGSAGCSCRPEWFKLASGLVWDFCSKSGLNPTLESWHDGVGIESGYNIVVHWE